MLSKKINVFKTLNIFLLTLTIFIVLIKPFFEFISIQLRKYKDFLSSFIFYNTYFFLMSKKILKIKV